MARRRALRVGLALLATGVAAVVAHDVATEPAPPTYAIVRHPNAAGPPPPSRRPPSRDTDCGSGPVRWLVVGWDGASWDLMAPLLEQGRLPNLAGLIERGAAGSLAGFEPSLSPVLWTTVATGVSPERHGIKGFDKRRHRLLRRLERVARLGGLRRELYTNADRRAPALWNLASDAGLRVLVVGYHNTYPAETVRGAMVSNYLVQAYIKEIMRANRELPDAFRRSLTWPPELADEVLGAERRVERELPEAIGRFARLDATDRARFANDSRSLEADRRMYFLRQAWVFDTFHAEAALELHRRIDPDIAMVHFQGVDLASHYFLPFYRPDWYGSRPPEAAVRLERERGMYADTLPAFYAYLDEWLGRLLELRDERTAVMVLSDHGFEPEPDPERGGQHAGAPPGILVVAGPGIRAGSRLDGATLYDVLPTLAAAAGLPVARDLPGRVLDEMFCDGAPDAAGARKVDSYGSGGDWAPEIAPPPELVDEIERQLRSLGYVD